jgi:ATP-binding cassette subfamily B protein
MVYRLTICHLKVLQQLLQDGLAQFFIQADTIVIVTLVFFTSNVKLAALTVPIVLTALTLHRRHRREPVRRVRDRYVNRQRNNIIRHRTIVGHYRRANFATAQVTAAYSAGSGLIGQPVLLLIGGDMVIRHHLPVGVLVAFILYLGLFFQPIQQLVQLYSTYQQGQAAVTELRDLVATDPTIGESPAAYQLPPIEGSITFENMWLGYDPRRSRAQRWCRRSRSCSSARSASTWVRAAEGDQRADPGGDPRCRSGGARTWTSSPKPRWSRRWTPCCKGAPRS